MKKGTVFIGIGIVFLMSALFLAGYNIFEAENAKKASESVLPKLEELMKKTDLEEEVLPAVPEREMPAVEIDGYRYIGTLEIPALERTLPVMEEWDMNRLKKAVCCYSGSVYKDNMVIAGHNYRKHFSPIKDLPEGTEVIFTDMENQSHVYQIGWTEILESEAVNDMITGDWDLTLFTCTYGGGSRYAVRCCRVK